MCKEGEEEAPDWKRNQWTLFFLERTNRNCSLTGDIISQMEEFPEFFQETERGGKHQSTYSSLTFKLKGEVEVAAVEEVYRGELGEVLERNLIVLQDGIREEKRGIWPLGEITSSLCLWQIILLLLDFNKILLEGGIQLPEPKPPEIIEYNEFDEVLLYA